MGVLWFFNLNEFIKKYNITTLVETGTGRGDGLLYAQRFPFKKIYTIELLPDLINIAKSRTSDPRITFLQGTSKECLERILPELKNETILFWLDCHYPGVDFSSDRKIMDVEKSVKLPLENEVRTIKELRPNNKDVILIDDVKIYIFGPFQLGSSMVESPVGNMDFVYELFLSSHKFSLKYDHDGYLILEPKE